MNKRSTRFFPLVVAIAVIVGILIGNFFANYFSGNRLSIINASGNKLGDLLYIINDQYVDEVNVSDLVERAIPKILAELDPHSAYIPAADAQAAKEDLAASFSGIGVLYSLHADTPRVTRIVEGGPAERSGLMPGDRLLSVDNKTLLNKELSVTDITKMLRGAQGSATALHVFRPATGDSLNITITRGNVPTPTVLETMLSDGHTGYISVSSFGEGTYAEFLASLARLHAQNFDQLIIDLCDNGGGYLKPAVQMANEFLRKGQMIVYDEGAHYPKDEFRSDGRGAYQEIPLVVLIDNGTASASEIFAGAIQDNDRGTIVGRRSFGKGLVQVPIDMRDGSTVRLTHARYYTPSGRCLQKPYSDDIEEYAMEVYDRWLDGEYYSADSVSHTEEVYYTAIGRPVYGGGGIIPDVFVPLDTAYRNNYFQQLIASGLLREYVQNYVDANRDRLPHTADQLREYLAPLNLTENFVRYAEKHGVKRRNVQLRLVHNALRYRLDCEIASECLSPKEYVAYWAEMGDAPRRAAQILEAGLAFPTCETLEEESGDSLQ